VLGIYARVDDSGGNQADLKPFKGHPLALDQSLMIARMAGLLIAAILVLPANAHGTPTIKAEHAGFDRHLTDGSGVSIYLFEEDAAKAISAVPVKVAASATARCSGRRCPATRSPL
jgi:predicted lipoprotein with Yx(FWY)xxD motif